MERQQVDITGYSYEHFVSFLFDHEVVGTNEGNGPWYWNVDVTFEPANVCLFYKRFFRQPEFILRDCSKPKLEQGFWAIQGPNLACSVSNIIWNDELPFSSRSECVRSMTDLFTRLFANEPLETSVQMWWDSLCYDWNCGNRERNRGGEDLLMQDVLFETLSKLLKSDSEICQGAALHGLGHLHHPKTEELIDSYMRERPSLSEDWKKYALAAAKFEVL